MTKWYYIFLIFLAQQGMAQQGMVQQGMVQTFVVKGYSGQVSIDNNVLSAKSKWPVTIRSASEVVTKQNSLVWIEDQQQSLEYWMGENSRAQLAPLPVLNIDLVQGQFRIKTKASLSSQKLTGQIKVNLVSWGLCLIETEKDIIFYIDSKKKEIQFLNKHATQDFEIPCFYFDKNQVLKANEQAIFKSEVKDDEIVYDHLASGVKMPQGDLEIFKNEDTTNKVIKNKLSESFMATENQLKKKPRPVIKIKPKKVGFCQNPDALFGQCYWQITEDKKSGTNPLCTRYQCTAQGTWAYPRISPIDECTSMISNKNVSDQANSKLGTPKSSETVHVRIGNCQ